MKVYWVKTAEMSDVNSEGYVGVTVMEISERLYFHNRNNRFPDGYDSVELIFEGTDSECLDLEFELRPTWYVGWNIAPGGQAGNRPPGIHTSGWTHSEEAKAKRAEMWKGNTFGNKETVADGIVFESQLKAVAYLKEKYGLSRAKSREHILQGTPIEELQSYRYNPKSALNYLKRKKHGREVSLVMGDQKFSSINNAAEELGVSRGTVYNLMKKGAIRRSLPL